MVFDLARCSSKKIIGGSEGRGVTISSANEGLPEARRKAVKAYKSIHDVTNPVLGKIETTRLGWRHMFRRSRAARNKAASLDLIPVLGTLLKQHPSSNAIVSTDFFTKDGFEHRTCEHLLKFAETSVFRKCNRQLEKATTYIRVIEEIRYPKDWADKAMLSQLIARRVVLKSAYYKCL